MDRYGKEKRGALQEGAFDADVAAHGAGEVFDDGQAKSGAAELAGASLVNAIEAFEEAGKVFGRDSDTGIGNGDLDGFVGLGDAGASTDGNGTAGGRVLEGVVDQSRSAARRR